MTIVAHDVGGVGGMEQPGLEALIMPAARARDRGVAVISRTIGLLRRTRGCDGTTSPVRRVRSPFRILFVLRACDRFGPGPDGPRGVLLQTTGAIVLNRADVCTVHYIHNGPSKFG